MIAGIRNTLLLLVLIQATRRAEAELSVPVQATAARCPTDLMIVIDNSASVKPFFNEEKEIASALVEGLEVSPDGTRIALIDFNENPTLVFPFNKYPEKEDVAKAIGEVKPLGGATNTAGALELAFKELSEFNRRSANLIILLITDGNSQNTIEELEDITNKLTQAGVIIFIATASPRSGPLEFSIYTLDHWNRMFTKENFTSIVVEVVKTIKSGACINVTEVQNQGRNSTGNLTVAETTELPITKPTEALATTTPDCSELRADVIFLLDGSSSIGTNAFEKQVLTFVRELTQTFQIGEKNTEVGIMQFSHLFRNEIHLNQFDTRDKLLKAIAERVHILGGRTLTGAAIQNMTNVGFSNENGARDGFPKVGIVVTDGRSQDDVVAAAKEARNAGIRLIAVGVTKHVSFEELLEIAGRRELVFFAKNFTDLNAPELKQLIQNVVCNREFCPADNDCGAHAGCIPLANGAFKCECLQGFKDMDPKNPGKKCESGPIGPGEKRCFEEVCSPNAICEDLPAGGVLCICKNGTKDESPSNGPQGRICTGTPRDLNAGCGGGCNLQLGETCVDGKHCACPIGMARVTDDDKCEEAQEIVLPLRVLCKNSQPYTWNSSFSDIHGSSNRLLEKTFVEGMTKTIALIDFAKSNYLGNRINSVQDPKLTNATWKSGLMFNYSVFVKPGSVDPEALCHEILNTLLINDLMLSSNGVDLCVSELKDQPRCPKNPNGTGDIPCSPKKCSSLFGELCRDGKCVCPIDMTRGNLNSACEKVDTFPLIIRIATRGNQTLIWQPVYIEPQDPQRVNIFDLFRSAIKNAYLPTPLWQFFVDTRPERIQNPTTFDSNWTTGLIFRFNVSFVEGKTTCQQAWAELLKSIKADNGVVGKTELTIDNLQPPQLCAPSTTTEEPGDIPCNGILCSTRRKEQCVKGQCVCLEGKFRGQNSTVCQDATPISFSCLVVIRKDEQELTYNSSFADTNGDLYKNLSDLFKKGVGQAYDLVNLGRYLVNTEVHAIKNASKEGVCYDFTIYVKPGSGDRDFFWNSLITSFSITKDHVGHTPLIVAPGQIIPPVPATALPQGPPCDSNKDCNTNLGEICPADQHCDCPPQKRRNSLSSRCVGPDEPTNCKNDSDCIASFGEICSEKGECICSETMKRPSMTQACIEVIRFLLPVQVVRENLRYLNYTPSYASPEDSERRRLAAIFIIGIANAIRNTSYANAYVTNELREISDPRIANTTWNFGLLFNDILFFKAGSIPPADALNIWVELLAAITATNYSIGGTSLFINPLQPNSLTELPPLTCSTAHPCPVNTTCRSVDGVARCVCIDGFVNVFRLSTVKEALKCVDQTTITCASGVTDCDPNALCTDSALHGYICSCKAGYTDGDLAHLGRVCNPAGSSPITGTVTPEPQISLLCTECSFHGTCLGTNDDGTMKCQCEKWYSGSTCATDIRAIIALILALLFLLLCLCCCCFMCLKCRCLKAGGGLLTPLAGKADYYSDMVTTIPRAKLADYGGAEQMAGRTEVFSDVYGGIPAGASMRTRDFDESESSSVSGSGGSEGDDGSYVETVERRVTTDTRRTEYLGGESGTSMITSSGLQSSAQGAIGGGAMSESSAMHRIMETRDDGSYDEGSTESSSVDEVLTDGYDKSTLVERNTRRVR